MGQLGQRRYNGVDAGKNGLCNGHQGVAQGNAQLVKIQAHNAHLICQTAGGPGEIPLSIPSDAKQIIVAQQHLFRLGHGSVALGDALGQGVGLQVRHTHVDAQLFKRLRLPADAGTDFFKGLVCFQIIKGCQVPRQAGQRQGHLLGRTGNDAGRFEHSAHGSGILLC